jgi:hypothetical protein
VEHRPRLTTSSMAGAKSSPSMETNIRRSHTVVRSSLSQPRRRAVQLFLWSSSTQWNLPTSSRWPMMPRSIRRLQARVELVLKQRVLRDSRCSPSTRRRNSHQTGLQTSNATL